MKINLKTMFAALLFVSATLALINFSSCGGEEENPCGITCKNNGELIMYEDYCYCECPPGFEGEQCEIAPE